MNIQLIEDANGLWLGQFIESAHLVLDAGCGPNGSHWWKYKPDHVKMVAVDLYFRPTHFPPNTQFFQQDLLDFSKQNDYIEKFDVIVADHILEHVDEPKKLVYGFNRMLQSGGILHVGVPDANQFSDKFYRLIHHDGGGHVSKITRSLLVEMMAESGFDCVAIRPWPEDYNWLRYLFDWQRMGISHINQDDICFIADVLQRELTIQKGYYYGWEAIFSKKSQATYVSKSPQVDEATSLTTNKKKASQSNVNPSEMIWSPASEFSSEEIVELQKLVQFMSKVKRKWFYLPINKIFRLIIR